MRNKRRLRRAFGILFVVGIAAFLVLPARGEEQTDGKTVLIVVSFDGFDKWEYVRTRRVFDQAGIRSTVASTQPGEASSDRSLKIPVDVVLEDVDVKLYDAVVFIGGGYLDLLGNEVAYELVRQAAEQGKVLAAICIAPLILGEAGVLDGREATILVLSGNYTGTDPYYWADTLEATGAIFVHADVIVSSGESGESTIITAPDPDCAYLFTEAILQAIGVEGEPEQNGSDA